MAVNASNYFSSVAPGPILNVWTEVMNYTQDETMLRLNKSIPLDTRQIPGRHTSHIFEAMLFLRRYSFQQSPRDISLASLTLLRFAPLKENMPCCYLYFVLACRSLDIFERTSEIGHLDRAISLLEDFWDEQKSFAVGLTLCRACVLHYLVSSEPQACESAVNILQEIRKILPTSVSTRTLMIIGDVIRDFDINEAMLSTLTSILDSVKLTSQEFTAFQALVACLIFEILHKEHGTWHQSLADLYVAVSSTESVIKNAVQLNDILDSLDPSVSFARSMCLFYVAEVLDAEGFTLHSEGDACNSSNLWTTQCKEAIQYFRNILASKQVRTTFIPFTLKGYPQQRPNSGIERYIQSDAGPRDHNCIFEFSVLIENKDELSAEISHEQFCWHLQKLCDTAPRSQLAAAVKQAENLDRFLDMSSYLRRFEERILLWRECATTKAYILFRLNAKDSEISKKIATDVFLDLEIEPGHAQFAYQLASNLCNLEKDPQALNIASRLFSEFLRIQQRGSIKRLMAMVELAKTYLLAFLHAGRKGNTATLAFAFELFREAIESSKILMESYDSWSTEARKVIVIARILHYRFSRFSDSEDSLSLTFTECSRLLDHLPIGLPFCASTLEVLIISALFYLSQHTKTSPMWHNSIKYFSRVIDKFANGTNDTEFEEMDGDARTIVDEVIMGGLDPVHSIKFASEAMCVLHISDMFRSFGEDCCKKPGFLRVSIHLYLRNLELESEVNFTRFEENERILQTHSRHEKKALRSAMLSLVRMEPTVIPDDPQLSSLSPGSLSIFKYRAGYSNSSNKSSTTSYRHSCVLYFTPIQVSQVNIDIEDGCQVPEVDLTSSNSEESTGGTNLLTWPEDLMMFPDENYLSSQHGMPSTLIPGFDKISIDERHELFSKMPLEARTIRALMRSTDSEVRDIEKSSSYLVQNFIRELRQPPTWNRANVGHQARINQIKNMGHDITQYGPLQALLTRGPEQCLELIESSRSIFWTRLLRLKTSFAGLPDDLEQSLRYVAEEIEGLQSNAALTGGASKEESQKQFELEAVFESLVIKARSIPGFKNFLRPKTHDILMQASSGGPIVILLGTKSIYAALIVQTTGIEHVFLSELNDELLDALAVKFNKAYHTARSISREEESADRYGRPKRKTSQNYDILLAKLWTLIVQPVFHSLGFLKCRKPLNERSRLWWCPTGKFTLLPIHAAGTDFGTPDFDCVWNYAVSSYIPTLSSLASARSSWTELQKKSISEMEVLVVAQPKTDGHPDLPMTVEELKTIENIVPRHQLLNIDNSTTSEYWDLSELNTNRTVAEVTESLTRASILHLACHGHHDSKDPLNSGFALADGRLSLAKLISCYTPHAFFAFLSACESAAVDVEVPDESLSLSVAMLYAGFRSVIGTMWTMDDNDGPEIARFLYRGLFQDGKEALEPNAIPFALDAAVRKLHQTGAHPSRWATYVHVGM